MSKRIQFDADDLLYEAQMNADTPDGEPERCRATGKVIWRKPSSAANVAKNMRASRSDSFIESYRCQFCGFWHVGHAKGTPRARHDLLQLHKRS